MGRGGQALGASVASTGGVPLAHENTFPKATSRGLLYKRHENERQGEIAWKL